jgi:hypothetical protein
VELARAGSLASTEIVADGAACLVLERPETAPSSPRLKNLDLVLADAPPHDPLAPFIGRTVAAAPLLLVALAVSCGAPRRLAGCGGHEFSFEVA